MGWQDRMAAAASTVATAAGKNRSSIERGIDRAIQVADERTGSKYTQHLQKGGEGLRTGLSKLTESGGSGTGPR